MFLNVNSSSLQKEGKEIIHSIYSFKVRIFVDKGWHIFFFKKRKLKSQNIFYVTSRKKIFMLARNAAQIPISESYILNSFSQLRNVWPEVCMCSDCSHDSASRKCVVSLYSEGEKKKCQQRCSLGIFETCRMAWTRCPFLSVSTTLK